MTKVKTFDPSTGRLLAEYGSLTDIELDSTLDRAREGFVVWRKLPVLERGAFLLQLGRELRAEKEELAGLITLEMGKPIVEARQEIEKCALACDYYSGQAAEWLEDRILIEKNPKCLVSFRPLGVILGIMPWNFPFWQTIRFALPTLMAGNVVMIKHAPNTWGCSRRLAECFWKAGFARGVYQDLPVDVETTGQVIADSRVAGVSLTGSTRAGRSVGEIAGRWLKKAVLELGGSDPYVVLDDADVALAADKAVTARMLNGGQSCIAGKRFIVTRKNYDEFHDRVFDRLGSYVAGDPRLESTNLGPMARADLRDQLHAQVLRAVGEGAHLEMGGVLEAHGGFFYPPTLLTNVTTDSMIHQEELFGPVAAIAIAHDEAEAFRLANSTPFGLGAAVFSRDEDRALALARTELNAGMCFVNGIVRSDPRWPFGGIKESGLGRELSEYGTREFVNVKTIVVDPIYRAGETAR